MNWYSVLILTVSAFSAAAGQILFKIGATGRTSLIEYLNVSIITGLFLYGVSTVIWIYVLSFEKLVNVYVFTVLTFVLVYVGGVVLIKETITLGGIIGVLFVLTGLYIITNYGNQ